MDNIEAGKTLQRMLKEKYAQEDSGVPLGNAEVTISKAELSSLEGLFSGLPKVALTHEFPKALGMTVIVSEA